MFVQYISDCLQKRLLKQFTLDGEDEKLQMAPWPRSTQSCYLVFAMAVEDVMIRMRNNPTIASAIPARFHAGHFRPCHPRAVDGMVHV